MADLLEALHSLQVIELKIAAIRAEQEGIERRINSHQRKLRKLGDRLDANRLAHRERQMRIDGLNLEIATRDESAQPHAPSSGSNTSATTRSGQPAIATDDSTSASRDSASTCSRPQPW